MLYPISLSSYFIFSKQFLLFLCCKYFPLFQVYPSDLKIICFSLLAKASLQVASCFMFYYVSVNQVLSMVWYSKT
jgi:hypothetical protein